VFVDDFFAFGVCAVVLGLGVVINELTRAHLEDFHGVKQGARPSEALKIKEAFSIDEIVLIKILGGEFFVKLKKVAGSG
jgi:hypothetical protein